jgi:hypothetical protein
MRAEPECSGKGAGADGRSAPAALKISARDLVDLEVFDLLLTIAAFVSGKVLTAIFSRYSFRLH